jgi:hypothetical protein
VFIHIVPRIHATERCALVDLTIKEFDLTLTAEHDLSLCHPYRNGRYLVACRQGVKWGAEGILLNTPAFLPEFTVITRWAVADRHIAVHSVRYYVPADYDPSQDMLSSCEPRMLDKPLVPHPKHRNRTVEIQDLALDTVDALGYLIERNEIATLQRHPRHLYRCCPSMYKLPQVKDCFDLCSAQPYVAS